VPSLVRVRIVVSERVQEVPAVRVSVDDVIYMPSLDAPSDRPHPFVYFVTIRNNGITPVTVRARKWVIEQNSGEHLVVEGDGVVGQFPCIQPNSAFAYNSYHVVGDDAKVRGAFFLEKLSGDIAYVSIPEFKLCVPRWV